MKNVQLGQDLHHHTHNYNNQNQINQSPNETTTIINETSGSKLSRFVAAAIFYGVTSTFVTIGNKALISSWTFDYTISILTTQHLATVLILHSMQMLGIITLAPFQMSVAKRIFPLAVCYTVNVLVALLSLKTLAIPMYGILKRMATVFTLILEWALLSKIPSRGLVYAILLMSGGAVLAGWGDLDFSMIGYILAMTSSIFQSLYLILVVKVGSFGSDSFEMLYYNSTLVVPFLLFVGLFSGEFSQSLQFPYFWDLSFQLTFIANLISGAVLQYSMFLCTRVNSPVTTSVVGHVKNIATVLVSLFLFEQHFSVLLVVGLGLNIAGGVLFSNVKFKSAISSNKNPPVEGQTKS